MTPNEIAADVSARYGVPVNPAVVQILPARVPVDPDCYWCEKSQALVNRENGRNTMRKIINLQTNAMKAAREKSLKAYRAQVVDQKAQRIAELRAFTALGATLEQLAKHMRVKPNTAERYALANKIDYIGKPKPRQSLQAELDERRAKVLELHKAGLSGPKIASALNLSPRVVRRDLEALL